MEKSPLNYRAASGTVGKGPIKKRPNGGRKPFMKKKRPPLRNR